MKKKIIWGSIIVLLVGGSIAAYYIINAFNEKNPTAADLKTDMKVEAEPLMQEFIKDKSAAEKKYGKTTIEITGVIAAIEHNGEDDISVSLLTTATDDIGIPLSVKVMLIPDESDKVKSLKEGEKVTLKGIYKGMNTDIEFNRGIIIE